MVELVIIIFVLFGLAATAYLCAFGKYVSNIKEDESKNKRKI